MQEEFDKFAKNYRSIHNENIKISGADSAYFSEYKVQEIKKQEKGNFITLLDIGCGDGISAFFFKKYYTECIYYGIDVSPESIRIAKEKKLPVSFETYEGNAIPYPNEKFDVVFIACVLHHIDFNQHLNLLHEARRVLKNNGRLYIFEHNPYNPFTRKIVKDCIFDKDAVLLKQQYSKTLVKKAGFKKYYIKHTLFFPRYGFFKRLLFLENILSWIPIGGQYYIRAINQ